MPAFSVGLSEPTCPIHRIFTLHGIFSFATDSRPLMRLKSRLTGSVSLNVSQVRIETVHSCVSVSSVVKCRHEI
ncbi:uncharacterized protein RSE6_10218 [Rhynchosporium secalis]|uniref:Uncharacterized protein n=1 Tax=Rhynchosporium secalis TaxID=38038 RepID=A0A1E1MJX6_RHYSE|nr:uncharacterized protein RSE6_10218 [Rhynchosporium secalis]